MVTQVLSLDHRHHEEWRTTDMRCLPVPVPFSARTTDLGDIPADEDCTREQAFGRPGCERCSRNPAIWTLRCEDLFVSLC
jgi:hypothetical protein